MKTKDHEKLMTELAKATNTCHDGSDDNRLFYDNESINVFANLMTKQEYKIMEKAIKASIIERAHYAVYAWNDVSGYEYWKKEGENHYSSNYIQVTAHIKNPAKVDAKKLRNDIQSVFDSLYGFDNMEEFYYEREQKRLAGAK